MEEEYIQIDCKKCGNKMEVVDSWQTGFREHETAIIACDKCGEEERVDYKGGLRIEKGAVMKREYT
jgi:RNase P subunit RPR2